MRVVEFVGEADDVARQIEWSVRGRVVAGRTQVTAATLERVDVSPAIEAKLEVARVVDCGEIGTSREKPPWEGLAPDQVFEVASIAYAKDLDL